MTRAAIREAFIRDAMAVGVDAAEAERRWERLCRLSAAVMAGHMSVRDSFSALAEPLPPVRVGA